MKQGFNSILGNWGVYIYTSSNMGVELSHDCAGAPRNTNRTGKCVVCYEQIPEEVAQAALLIPKLALWQYPKLYEDK